MPLRVGHVVLRLGVAVVAQQHRQRAVREQHLLPGVEHVARSKHRADAVERRGRVGEAELFVHRCTVPARREAGGHRPGQRMRLPQHVVRDPDLAQQLQEARVTAEDRVQAGLEDVAVAVAPRRQLAAQDRPLLEHQRGAPRVGEEPGRSQACRSAADDQRVNGTGAVVPEV